MAKKGGASVYIDLQLKQMVDVIAPIMGTSLSELINSKMEEYLSENSPLEIIDMQILKLESELAELRLEREKVAGALKIHEVISKHDQESRANKEKAEREILKFREEKLSDPEAIRSLTYQVKHKTIDWNVIKTNMSFDTAIDAREAVLTYLLDIGKITSDECRSV
jgi:hypothetical protein